MTGTVQVPTAHCRPKAEVITNHGPGSAETRGPGAGTPPGLSRYRASGCQLKNLLRQQNTVLKALANTGMV